MKRETVAVPLSLEMKMKMIAEGSAKLISSSASCELFFCPFPPAVDRNKIQRKGSFRAFQTVVRSIDVLYGHRPEYL